MNTEKLDNPALRIMSIFNLLRMNALTLSGEATARDVQAFCFDVASVSEIGLDEANKIWAETADAETLNLAAHLSAVLNHADLPEELFNAIQDGLDDVTAVSNSKALNRIERSADYITEVLADYRDAKK